MRFRELNSGFFKKAKIEQRFLEKFSSAIKKELGIKPKCPSCLSYNIEAWIKILDVQTYARGIPYEMIGRIDHCTCADCGVMFFPIRIKEKEDPPGNYTAYHHLYHFYVNVRYSMSQEELQQLLES